MTTPYTIPNPPPPLAINSLLGADLSIITWVGVDGSRWPLSGGMAPVLACQDGVIINQNGVKGLMGPFKMLDQSSAHQDGTTFLDAVWEPLELDMGITIAGQTPDGYRVQQRAWMNSWDPKLTGTLFWFTRSLGEWWLTLRLFKEPDDTLKMGPASVTKGEFNWTARADDPFWQSFDSISSLVASGASTFTDPLGINANNFLSLCNRGDQVGWPRYLVQGPFTTIRIADANSGAYCTFGPLAAGQTALITTEPRIQTIKNVTSGANLYPLLVGRFQNPIPAFQTMRLNVTGTGMTNGVTQINGSLTPKRKWPE